MRSDRSPRLRKLASSVDHGDEGSLKGTLHGPAKLAPAGQDVLAGNLGGRIPTAAGGEDGMRRIAGTFVLLAGLSGCISFTGQPTQPDGKTTGFKSIAPASTNYLTG